MTTFSDAPEWTAFWQKVDDHIAAVADRGDEYAMRRLIDRLEFLGDEKAMRRALAGPAPSFGNASMAERQR